MAPNPTNHNLNPANDNPNRCCSRPSLQQAITHYVCHKLVFAQAAKLSIRQTKAHGMHFSDVEDLDEI